MRVFAKKIFNKIPERIRDGRVRTWTWILFFASLLVVLSVFLSKFSVNKALADTNPDEWNMAGGNPQRTSWITENVTTATGITWYRPIEAYIDQETQIVTGNGNIYVSTSKGLLVLDAENGSLKWRFDTELPLGQSPTIVGDMVYVAGFDHKLYALQDLGSSYGLVWTFSEAGFGYSSNPLVVNGTVYIGNRDGYFYAVNATTGAKTWQYPSAGNDPIGAIAQSAAYSAASGDIYFASRDMYAYALDATTGALTWKSSSKLPGERYESWWPVVWGDKVVFTGSFPFKSTTNPGSGSETCVIGATPGACSSFKYLQDEDLFPGAPSTSSFYAGVGSTSTGADGWTAGNSLIDSQTSVDPSYPSLQSYADTYSDRAVVVLYDQATGNKLSNAPILFEGTYSGAKYPPVIDPSGQTAYIQNYYQKTAGDGIARKITVGWKYGNRYLKIKGSHYAIDEPAALSGMGTDSVLFNLLVDREAIVLGENRVFWNYPDTLDGVLPYTTGAVGEYDPMWRFYTNEGEYERLKGYYKGNIDSINGVYGSAGQQNPLVPYAFTNGSSQRVERIFTHRSNTIIAIGENSNKTALPLITVDAVDMGGEGTSISDATMTTRLEKEVDKILDIYEADNTNGFLKPGYYNHDSLGNIDRFSNFYYDVPGDTLLALAQAYPHVSAATQTRMLNYMTAYYNRFYNSAVVMSIGWSGGYDRTDMDYPSQIDQAMLSLGDSTSGAFPQRSFYALWKYVEIMNDQNVALSVYNKVSPYLTYPPNPTDIGSTLHMRSPQKYHEYIQGYQGFLNIQEMALGGVYNSGQQTQRTNLTNEIASLESYRVNNFSKDHFIAGTGDNPGGITITAYNRKFNLARNFLFLTPEIGSYFASSIAGEVASAVDEYSYVGPWWFVNGNRNSFQEGAMDHLYNANALLSAKAYVEGRSQDELSKYIDAPIFPRGDMMYIQNLVMALEASTSSLTRAESPVFSVGSTSFSDTISIGLSSTTAGASIYYTTDGSTPSQSSTLYNGAFTLNSTSTVRAIAYASGYDPSLVSTATYTLTVEAPVLSPTTGTFTDSVTVSVGSTQSGVSLYYTTNGVDPNNGDTLLVGNSLMLNSTTNLKMVAYLRGSYSSVTSETYTVNSSSNVAPVSSFSLSPASGVIPLTVNFDASGSSDSDGTIVSYTWDFGDGSNGTGATTSHLYTVAGSYTISLTVTDNDGATNTSTDSISANAGSAPVISSIVHSGTGNKFEKYEVSFNVSSNVSGLNPYLPYISSVGASGIGGVDVYAEKGIDVVGSFQYKGVGGTLSGEPVYQVPAFYSEEQTYNSANNTPGYDWIYPSGNSGWKLRFSPDRAGVWEMSIGVTDANGSRSSSSSTFTVSDNSKKGFIKVSSNDSKYFEYENGDYFKGLGYAVSVSDRNPISDSTVVAAKMGSGGMDLARFWLSGWGVFGGAWAPPFNELAYEDGYLPYQSYTANQHDSDSELSIRMGYYPSGNPGNSPMCLLYGGQSPIIAVEANTTYRITLRYMTSGVSATAGGGLIVKMDQGVYLNRNTCNDTAFGTEVTVPVTGTSSGWQNVSGEVTTGASQEFLSNIYVTLDGVTAGSAYVDSLLVEKLDGPGGNVLYQVNPDFSADVHTSFNQRDAYAFDRMLENFEANEVALKLVLLEKMDKVGRQFDSNGNWAASPDQNNIYGNTASPRSDTKTRWLQKAWWKYVQARWGYSTAIHSFELLNEGDPNSATHFALADELGKYMKCGAYGQSVGSGDASSCNYDHPNHHLVSTSTWHSFPGYWASANYPNIDYADIHQYIPAAYSNYLDNFTFDKYRYYIQNVQPALASIDLSRTSVAGIGKPVIRGEVGFTNTGTEPYNSAMDYDTNGIWLHDFIWGSLNGGGIMEQYWYTGQQISSNSLDLNHLYGAYSKFISEESLNDGGYSEINFNNVAVNSTGQNLPNPRFEQDPNPLTAITDMDDVIITGLKNVSLGRGVFWVKNVHHNWCVLKTYNEAGVNASEVANCDGEQNYTTVPYNFNIELSGFTPGASYTLEKWNTWTPWTSLRSEQIESTSTVTADGSGVLSISQTNLTTDAAYKLIESGSANANPVASFTKSPASGTAPATISLDAQGSSDSDGTIVSYTWDFGDGSNGTGATTSHTYVNAGTYAILLTVTDDQGGVDVANDTVVIGTANVAPSSSFSMTNNSGKVPLTVSFDASGSSDSDGSISSYLWDFGDGSNGTGVTTSHLYTVTGSYTVSLTVTDDDGSSDVSSGSVTASPANVAPSASYVTSSGGGLSLSFNAAASSDSDGSIASYTWDFGDGGNGSGVSVSHTYGSAGEYSVVLTVTDNDGATGTSTHIINLSVSSVNTLPSASYSNSLDSGTVPLTISFNAAASSDSDGSIASYTWDFGDGSSGSGVSISHTFNSSGSYVVRLSVTDNEGGVGSFQKTITANNASSSGNNSGSNNSNSSPSPTSTSGNNVVTVVLSSTPSPSPRIIRERIVGNSENVGGIAENSIIDEKEEEILKEEVEGEKKIVREVKIRFVDEKGEVLANRRVVINNVSYETDGDGYISAKVEGGEQKARVYLGNGESVEVGFVLGDREELTLSLETGEKKEESIGVMIIKIISGVGLGLLLIVIIRMVVIKISGR